MIQSIEPRLRVVFYRTAAGTEPVREWLLNLAREDRRRMGEDIKTVQFGWPLGMPLVRPLGAGLFEVRTDLGGRIARVLFLADGGWMVLLHAFIKKSRKTPGDDLDLARRRAADLRRENAR
jgi:phage-related protein